MKTKAEKEKSVIKQLRDIRDKISREIQDLTFEELMMYLKKQKKFRTASGLHKQG